MSEVLIENYVGCFETKNLEDVTRETNEVNKSDSARECAVLCRDKSSYFGLDSVIETFVGRLDIVIEVQEVEKHINIIPLFMKFENRC